MDRHRQLCDLSQTVLRNHLAVQVEGVEVLAGAYQATAETVVPEVASVVEAAGVAQRSTDQHPVQVVQVRMVSWWCLGMWVQQRQRLVVFPV